MSDPVLKMVRNTEHEYEKCGRANISVKAYKDSEERNPDK